MRIVSIGRIWIWTASSVLFPFNGPFLHTKKAFNNAHYIDWILPQSPSIFQSIGPHPFLYRSPSFAKEDNPEDSEEEGVPHHRKRRTLRVGAVDPGPEKTTTTRQRSVHPFAAFFTTASSSSLYSSHFFHPSANGQIAAQKTAPGKSVSGKSVSIGNKWP
jgi:hypothetical protein